MAKYDDGDKFMVIGTRRNTQPKRKSEHITISVNFDTLCSAQRLKELNINISQLCATAINQAYKIASMAADSARVNYEEAQRNLPFPD